VIVVVTCDLSCAKAANTERCQIALNALQNKYKNSKGIKNSLMISSDTKFKN